MSSPEHSAEAVSAEKSSSNNKESAAVRAQRRRIRKEEENGGADMCAKYVSALHSMSMRLIDSILSISICRLTAERQELANLILSEINRKMTSVVWTPWISNEQRLIARLRAQNFLSQKIKWKWNSWINMNLHWGDVHLHFFKINFVYSFYLFENNRSNLEAIRNWLEEKLHESCICQGGDRLCENPIHMRVVFIANNSKCSRKQIFNRASVTFIT